jgi:hypothetical protein
MSGERSLISTESRRSAIADLEQPVSRALIVNVEGETTFVHLAWRIPIDDNSHRPGDLCAELNVAQEEYA